MNRNDLERLAEQVQYMVNMLKMGQSLYAMDIDALNERISDLRPKVHIDLEKAYKAFEIVNKQRALMFEACQLALEHLELCNDVENESAACGAQAISAINKALGKE